MEKITWNEIEQKLLEKYGQSFIDYITTTEKTDGFERNEKEIVTFFENWWNSWQEEGLAELDENWHDKRGAYVMLQLAFIGIKKETE